jgi:hypothetical protein
MMIILTAKRIDMHCNASILSKRLENMGDHFTRQIPNLLPLETKIDDRIGTI